MPVESEFCKLTAVGQALAKWLMEAVEGMTKIVIPLKMGHAQNAGLSKES